MPLSSIKEQLIRATREGYAVPLFNVFDPIAVDGVVAAVEAKQAPCIIGVYSGCFKDANIEAFAAYIRTRVKNLAAPVSMMLDHGESQEQAKHALDLGFTDVMFDGSRLPFEENIECTRQVVRMAHLRGAGAEAELGHVGQGSTYGEFGAQRLGFTDPDIVEKFVKKTRVDYLAIAFGNAHGDYKGEPLSGFRPAPRSAPPISIPLVMHGGSGLVDEQYREVISAGIAKINYFTGIKNAATARMVQAAAEENASMFGITAALNQTYSRKSRPLSGRVRRGRERIDPTLTGIRLTSYQALILPSRSMKIGASFPRSSHCQLVNSFGRFFRGNIRSWPAHIRTDPTRMDGKHLVTAWMKIIMEQLYFHVQRCLGHGVAKLGFPRAISNAPGFRRDIDEALHLPFFEQRKELLGHAQRSIRIHVHRTFDVTISQVKVFQGCAGIFRVDPGVVDQDIQPIRHAGNLSGQTGAPFPGWKRPAAPSADHWGNPPPGVTRRLSSDSTPPITWKPACKKRLTRANPNPLPAPVIKTLGFIIRLTFRAFLSVTHSLDKTGCFLRDFLKAAFFRQVGRA